MNLIEWAKEKYHQWRLRRWGFTPEVIQRIQRSGNSPNALGTSSQVRAKLPEIVNAHHCETLRAHYADDPIPPPPTRDQ